MKRIVLEPSKTGFDIDGVVADTMTSFISIAKRDYGIHNIVKERITSYWLEECLPIPDDIIAEIIEKILTDPFGTGLRPISGAVETLENLASVAPLTFVTARPVKKPIVQWMETVLPAISRDRIKIIATGEHSAKAGVLKDLGLEYFIEDHLGTCVEIRDAGITAIVFDQPWNRDDPHNLPRVHGWDELRSMAGLA